MIDVAPTCPHHGHHLSITEQAIDSHGNLRRWWGVCPGAQRDGHLCDFHAAHPFGHADEPRYCGCRATLHVPCAYAVETTEPLDSREPSLFDASP